MMLSIITVNYKQFKVTLELIDSLVEYAPENSEWIIVDNGSEEDIKGALEKIDTRIKVIISKDNLGFAGGNNLGLNYANGEYIFFINNDTVVTKSTFQPLLDQIHEKKIGMVCPKIHYYYTPNTIQYAGFTKINPFTGRNEVIGEREIDKGQFNYIKKTFFGHGAAMMVKKEVIEKVGGIPEDFFLYYEEMDWCKRIRKAGYSIIYNGRSVILHKESISVGKLSPLKEFYMTRNRILFMYRNYSKFNFFIFMLFFMVMAFPKRFIFLFNKNRLLRESYVSGVRSALLYILNKNNVDPQEGLRYIGR